MVTLEGYMDMRQFKRAGKSISEIARQTGYDRKTVRKYLRGGCDPNNYDIFNI